MKKIGLIALALLFSATIVFAGGGGQQSSGQQSGASGAAASAAPDKYHIGIVTGTTSQAEDSFRGAEELIKR